VSIYDTYRVVYTTSSGEDRPSAPKPRDLALVAFYREVDTIAKHPLVGKERIRVISEASWLESQASKEKR
jgi:hypothetical protein